MLRFTQFCNFQRAPGKISDFKIAAEAFEARNFLNIFIRVWAF